LDVLGASVGRSFFDGAQNRHCQYERVMGTMDPTSSQDGSSRTFRASQGLGGKTGNAAHRSYPRESPDRPHTPGDPKEEVEPVKVDEPGQEMGT
jgi:hypothetical protein